MAKIHEELLVIKLSKLIKDNVHEQLQIASDDLKSNLETIVQELAGSDVIVEVINE
jgi:hypothetical protein